jgi:hypothetical protein
MLEAAQTAATSFDNASLAATAFPATERQALVHLEIDASLDSC